ncbi:MAG: 30S ribosomal protein S6 [Gemmataceae bacterium]|nr:30S ribosomal protein S6 [Gemmataceae bacterium]MDW8264651.1 30S ribosomal protein S6 [Gemmataceae bacterium]
MPVNVYECMFLLDTAKVAGDVPAAAEKLHRILTKHQAEILASRPWDERRLAYPIGPHKKGLYYLTYFRVDGKKIRDIESDFKLNETILRTLILRVHPKLEETMLALARDENALALQAATAEASENGEGGEKVEEARPRRGRRSEAADKG